MMFGWLVLRPVFEIDLRESRDVAIERLTEAYTKFGQPKLFFVHGEYGELHLPVEQHRLWSPHLSYYVCQLEEKTILRGRFAPRMEIWTFIWIMYLAMAFTAFFCLVMEFSMRSIGEAWMWHWIAGAAVATIILIYVTANVGQQWSSDQMHQLNDRLKEILRQSNLIS